MMWGDEYVDERDARFINDRVHANIQRDGTFSVVPQMKGGVTTPDAAARGSPTWPRSTTCRWSSSPAASASTCSACRKEDLPKVWADLGHAVRVRVRQELPHGEDLRRARTSAASASATRPRSASTIEERFQGMESPAKMKLAVTGCPRNCAEAYVKDLGVVADRRRQLGDLRRRRGRRAHPQGRPAGHRGHRRRGDHADRAGSCSTTGRTRTGWSAPTRSCRGSASTRSARSSSTTPTGIAAGLDAADAGRRRRLRGPVEGAAPTRPTPGQFRTVAAAGGAAAGAGRGERRPCTAVHASAARPRSRSARAAPTPSTASRSPCSGCATARCGRCRRVCPHRGGPLADGQIDDEVVVCPLHLNAFDLDTGCSSTGDVPLHTTPSSDAVDGLRRSPRVI